MSGNQCRFMGVFFSFLFVVVEFFLAFTKGSMDLKVDNDSWIEFKLGLEIFPFPIKAIIYPA